MTSVTTLIKQIKERELRVGIMTKKFKKRKQYNSFSVVHSF